MRDDSHSSTHPLLPPTTEDDRVAWLRLLRSRRVGPTTFWRLLAEHGSAQAALDALPDVARAAGVANYEICPTGVIRAEMKAAKASGARMVCHGEPAYPTQLASIDDAPPILWVVGAPDILARPMVALVGARNASSLGLRMARKLSAELGEAGIVVVSGLARGIDTAAHLATLDSGTVAVLGGGVDVLYPSENTRLGEDIAAKGGARVSEQPMRLQPMARHFPMRNRIIAGMAQAVVVVEAAMKSGSLITARQALDQGREVLAVPGHPMDARAGGCNLLLRDGARLVRNAQDILESLPPLKTPSHDSPQFTLPLEEPRPQPVADHRPARIPVPMSGQAAAQKKPLPARDTAMIPAGGEERRSLQEAAALHQQILERLGPSPLPEDDLIRDLGGAAGTVTPALTDLELDGRIRRQPGGYLTLVPPS